MAGTDAPGADPDPRAALAAAFRIACANAGHTPPSDLQLLQGAEPATVDIVLESPWDLGVAHEQLTSPSDQTRRGAWYTPRAVATDLVTATITSVGSVLDPSCGGGVFLLAAADRLVSLGVDAGEVLSKRIAGFDVDPLAVAVTQAALWWWGRDHEVDVVPNALVAADALAIEWPETTFVVGNPPFLGQLRGETASGASERSRMRERFGDVVGAYTDPAAVFLLAAVEAVDDGGAVTLIQPQSVLASRDCTAVRARIDATAQMRSCWFGDVTTFAAAVDVCAPTFQKPPPASDGPGRRWADRLADHYDIPEVSLSGPDTLASMASVLAGFRDEYYGLVDAVIEGGDGPRLVTSGRIDPLKLRADRTIAFAKQRWSDPRIDVSRATDRAAGWVRRQATASVLVASQTRILECVADPTGDLVIGVPGLAVVPDDPEQVWRVAALLSAPCVSAWILRSSVGTGMSGDALRPTASLLAELPVPSNAKVWDEAASMARSLSENGDDDDLWRDFATAADASFGVTDAHVAEWWWGRHPRNSRTRR